MKKNKPKQTQFKANSNPFFVPKTPIKAKTNPIQTQTNPIQTQTNPIPAAHAIQNRLLNYEILQGKKI
jgi:hypothetical protein